MSSLLTGPVEQAQEPKGKPKDKKKNAPIKVMGSMLTGNDYQGMPEFSGTPADIQQFTLWQKTGPQSAPGMVKPGTIDLTQRPLVHHPDGSVSSLYSMSFGPDNQQILVPKVSPDGKMLTDKEAVALYEKTGQHLGVFNSVAAADAFAEMLHSKQGAFQTWKNGGKYKPSVETHASIPKESN